MRRTPLHFRLRRLLLAAALAAGCSSGAHANDVYVIANAELDLSPEEVKEIFLGEVQFAGSLKLQPVDNAGAQGEFLARVLKMSGSKYQGAWTKKAFRDGLNAPPLKASDAEVLSFVRSNPGAIGYVSAAPAGVRVVRKF
jgi:ABC-type phosphate transport system substrate-binding protein